MGPDLKSCHLPNTCLFKAQSSASVDVLAGGGVDSRPLSQAVSGAAESIVQMLESRIFPRYKVSVGSYTVNFVRNEKRADLPILMVHGAIVSHLYFLPAAELLSVDYEILIPDLVGHGESSKPAHTLLVEEQALTLHAFLEKLSIDKVHLMANSYGCEIACEFAVRYPERVDKLILIGPATDPHQPNMAIQLARLFYDGLVEHPMMSIVLLRDLWSMGMRRAIETSKIMIGYDYRPRLPLIKASTLIVRGDKDALAPQKWVEEAAALIPDARLDIVAGAPHNIQYTKPGPLVKLVHEFLQQHDFESDD